MLHRRSGCLPLQRDGFTATDSEGTELRAHLLLGRRRLRAEPGRGGQPSHLATRPVPDPFGSGAELLEQDPSRGCGSAASMLANELVLTKRGRIRPGCCASGRYAGVRDAAARPIGVLPGGLKVRRRAHAGRDSEWFLDAPDPLRRWTGSRSTRSLSTRRTRRRPGRHRPDHGRPASTGGPALLHPASCQVRTTTAWSASCSPRRRSACCSRRTRRSPGPRSAARARSARRARWPPAGLAEVLGGTPEQVGERGRDRHRAQPRADLRPGRRAGADPVHRAQRASARQGDHRRPDGRPRRRHAHVPSTRPSDHAGNRRRHEGQIQETARGGPPNVVECRHRPRAMGGGGERGAARKCEGHFAVLPQQ